MFNSHAQMLRKKKLEQEINSLQQYIDNAPEGYLICRSTDAGKYDFSTCFKDENGIKKEKYIPRRDIDKAEHLALKEYAMRRLKDCKKELWVINTVLQFYESEKQADLFLKSHPGIQTLVQPKLKSNEEYIRQWQEAEYVRSNKNPEHLIYPSIIPGLLVRSKAEADIISRLVYYKIPFRYEEQVLVDGEVYHPDFSCLNIRTLEKIYIEHQGGWDQQDYLRRNSGREEKLSRIGIIPWKNLLITTETKDKPLDINWVDILIQYFLM